MSVFPASKHLCSWARFALQNSERNGKKKTSRIGRAEVSLKPLLDQRVLNVIRVKASPEIWNHYSSFKNAGVTKKLSLPLQEYCWLLSPTFSRRMNTITPISISVAILCQNIEQFPWRRPSSLYKGKAISWHRAPLRSYHFLPCLKKTIRKGLVLCAFFCGIQIAMFQSLSFQSMWFTVSKQPILCEKRVLLGKHYISIQHHDFKMKEFPFYLYICLQHFLSGR